MSERNPRISTDKHLPGSSKQRPVDVETDDSSGDESDEYKVPNKCEYPMNSSGYIKVNAIHTV